MSREESSLELRPRGSNGRFVSLGPYKMARCTMLNRARVPWRDRAKERGRGKGWIEGQCLVLAVVLRRSLRSREDEGWMVFEGMLCADNSVVSTNLFSILSARSLNFGTLPIMRRRVKYDTIRFGKRARNDVDVGEENGETIILHRLFSHYQLLLVCECTHTHTCIERICENIKLHISRLTFDILSK